MVSVEYWHVCNYIAHLVTIWIDKWNEYELHFFQEICYLYEANKETCELF